MRVGKAWAVFVAGTLGSIGAAHADTKSTAPTKTAAPELEMPARPPLPPEPPSVPLPWQRHLEVGADLLYLARPTTGLIHLDATLGYGAHLHWELVRHLRFTFYFQGARHPVQLAKGALGLAGNIFSDPVNTYMFGVRFSPSIAFTPRLRAWLTAGFGWGRFEYPKMKAQDAGQAVFTLPERSEYAAEVPLGVGLSFDLIPRWLSLQAELTAAPLFGHVGTAVVSGQAIDAAGKKRAIGAMPEVDASIVQSLGLSLLL